MVFPPGETVPQYLSVHQTNLSLSEASVDVVNFTTCDASEQDMGVYKGSYLRSARHPLEHQPRADKQPNILKDEIGIAIIGSCGYVPPAISIPNKAEGTFLVVTLFATASHQQLSASTNL